MLGNQNSLEVNSFLTNDNTLFYKCLYYYLMNYTGIKFLE